MLSGQDVEMNRDEPVPEADALEQEQPVVAERRMLVSSERDDVPEADWLEQSVLEPFDDEDR
jgi:hypothetical protein